MAQIGEIMDTDNEEKKEAALIYLAQALGSMTALLSWNQELERLVNGADTFSCYFVATAFTVSQNESPF